MSDSESGEELLPHETCRNGHVLRKKKVAGTNSITGLAHMLRSNKHCTLCGKELKQGMIRHSCKQCAFHECEACFSARDNAGGGGGAARGGSAPARASAGYQGGGVEMTVVHERSPRSPFCLRTGRPRQRALMDSSLKARKSRRSTLRRKAEMTNSIRASLQLLRATGTFRSGTMTETLGQVCLFGYSVSNQSQTERGSRASLKS